MHQASVEKFGKDFVKPGNMVTNGAYKLAEFVPNSHIKLVKNENYYDAKNVQIDTVNYFPTPDFAAMVRRYEAGELDTTDDVPADQMKSLKERFKDQVQPRSVSRHLVPRRELLQGPLQRREGAPGPLHAGRPRVRRGADLGPDHAAGLFVHASGRGQLRRSGLHGATRTMSPIDREEKPPRRF